jgi:hypothetical protein
MQRATGEATEYAVANRIHSRRQRRWGRGRDERIYYVEGWDERSQSWVRLANRDYGLAADALTNACDSAANDQARYRVVMVETSVVQEFAPGSAYSPDGPTVVTVDGEI